MPYGYDVANAKLPQAADPIGSALQGGIQGITLGLGLQRARQDAQLNQLQQQAAMEEIENKKFENFKNLLGVTQFPSFNSFSKKDKDLVGKKLAEATADYLGVPLDSNGFEWKDIHGELINAVSKISDDKNISDQERKRLIANKLDEHIGKVSNDVLDQIRKNQEFGFKQSQPESFTFQGFSGNQPTFSSNRSPNLITGGGVTAEKFISKSEPSKIKEQQLDIAGQQDLVSSLRDKLNSIPSSIGGFATSGLAKVSGGIIAPETKAYLDIMPSAAVKIYRSTTGDTRLSDADAAARAYPIMPKPWEPKELQDSKLKDIEDALNGRGSKLKSLLTTGNASGSDNPKLKIPTFSDTEEAEYQKWKKQQTGK